MKADFLGLGSLRRRTLDHSSLAVTTVYLRRIEGQEDRSWAKVAAAIGV